MNQQLGYLFAVSGVVWIGTMFYVFSLLRRQSRLQRELDALQRSLKELNQS